MNIDEAASIYLEYLDRLSEGWSRGLRGQDLIDYAKVVEGVQESGKVLEGYGFSIVLSVYCALFFILYFCFKKVNNVIIRIVIGAIAYGIAYLGFIMFMGTPNPTSISVAIPFSGNLLEYGPIAFALAFGFANKLSKNLV